MTRNAVPGLAALALLAVACAKVAPPPGGPEDREPPTVLQESLLPVPGSAGVHPDEPVRIVFSERPDQRSVMRSLTVLPRVDFRDVAWSEDTLRILPADGWALDRSTILRLSTGAKDRRGNPLKNAFQFRFSTRAVPDSGEITGRVFAGREKSSTRPVVLLAYDAADVLDLESAAPHALAEAGPDGTYALSGLDTARSWRVLGLLDTDDDLRAEGRNEAFAFAPNTIDFPADSARARVEDFLVGTLDSLGTIAGEVDADSAAAVWVVVTPVEPGEPFRDGPRPGGGSFSIEVPTGAEYNVAAFVDADGDTLPDEGGPSAELEEPVSLRFTSRDSTVRFDLRTEEPEENLEITPGEDDADPEGGTETPAPGEDDR